MEIGNVTDIVSNFHELITLGVMGLILIKFIKGEEIL